MIAKFSPLLLVVLLGSSACPDNAATANSAISDLPKNKKVSDLTAAEQEQLCEATGAYIDREITPEEIKQALCSLQGILLSATLEDGSVDACVTARDQCLASPEQPTAVEAEGNECQLDWDACTTTVGELDACIEEAVDQLEAFYKELDCGNIGQYKGEMPGKEPELGEACKRVQTNCPGFLPGDLLSGTEMPPTS
jgi:hypothetical protein